MLLIPMSRQEIDRLAMLCQAYADETERRGRPRALPLPGMIGHWLVMRGMVGDLRALAARICDEVEP